MGIRRGPGLIPEGDLTQNRQAAKEPEENYGLGGT